MRNMRYIKMPAQIGIQYDRRPTIIDRYFKLAKLAPSERDQHFYYDDRLPALPDPSLTGQIRLDFLKLDGVIKLSIDTLDDTQAAGRSPLVRRRFFYYEQLISPTPALIETIEEEFGLWWTASIVNQLGDCRERYYSVIQMRDTVRYPDLIGKQPKPRLITPQNQPAMTPPATPAINNKRQPRQTTMSNTLQPSRTQPVTTPSTGATAAVAAAKGKTIGAQIKQFHRTFATPRSHSDSSDDNKEVVDSKGCKAVAATHRPPTYHTSTQSSVSINRNNQARSWTPSPVPKPTLDLNDSNDDIFCQIDLEALSRRKEDTAPSSDANNTPAGCTNSNLSPGPKGNTVDTAGTNNNNNKNNSQANRASTKRPADESVDIHDFSSQEREDPLLPYGQKRMKPQSSLHSDCQQASKQGQHHNLSPDLDQHRSDQLMIVRMKKKKTVLTSNVQPQPPGHNTTHRDDEEDDALELLERQHQLDWARRELTRNSHHESIDNDEGGTDDSDDTIMAKAAQKAREGIIRKASEAAHLTAIRKSMKNELANVTSVINETVLISKDRTRRSFIIDYDETDGEHDDDEEPTIMETSNSSNISATICSPPDHQRHSYKDVATNDGSPTPGGVTIGEFLGKLALNNQCRNDERPLPPAPTLTQHDANQTALVANRRTSHMEATTSTDPQRALRAITYPPKHQQQQVAVNPRDSHYMTDLVEQHLVEQQQKNGSPSEPFESNGLKRYVINYTHLSWRYVRPRATDPNDPQLLMRRRVGNSPSGQYNYYAVTNNMTMFQQAQETDSGAIRLRIPGDPETLHFVRVVSFDKICDSVYKQWITAAKQERLDRNNHSSQRFYITVHCDPIIEFMLDPLDIGNHAKITNTIRLRYSDVQTLLQHSQSGSTTRHYGTHRRSPHLIDLVHSRFSENISRVDTELFAARERLKQALAQEQNDQTVMAATSLITLSGGPSNPTSTPRAATPQLPPTPRRPEASLIGHNANRQQPTNHSRNPVMSQQRGRLQNPPLASWNQEQQGQRLRSILQSQLLSQPPTGRPKGPKY